MTRNLCRLAFGIVCVSLPAFGESVVPVSLSIRPSPTTVAQMDPQGQTSVPGTDTALEQGDIVTLLIEYTPASNNALHGVNGYLTVYIPDNTEVVGARFIDAAGNTLIPGRSGLSSDGAGGLGPRAYVSPLVNGSVAQLYADSGIFFSTDSRTARKPVPSPSEPFLSVMNGLSISPTPTGAAQVDNFLGFAGPPFYAHNEWDLTQVLALGVSGTITSGRGNTPEHAGNTGFGYGSPVAGPQSWYKLEATIDPPGAEITTANAKFLGNTGPWQRIRATGSETGSRGAGPSPPADGQVMPNPGAPSRLGIPAVDGSGNPLGWALSAGNPLPSTSPRTYAVRFATGELAVGVRYFAEVSLRVKQLPLESQSTSDTVCVESFAGDAASRNQTGSVGGKDHSWRYFVPSPACVVLNLLFTNSVNKVVAISGDTLTYTITARNLSTQTQQNVVVVDSFTPGDVSLDSTNPPGTASSGSVTWNVGTLAPGASAILTATFTVAVTGNVSTTNTARFTSQSLPTPGFTASTYTTISSLPVINLELEPSPSHVPAVPGVVRYTARIENQGTGAMTNACNGGSCYVEVSLPAGFSYQSGSSTINGAPAADPAIAGQKVRYSAAQIPASIAAGATLTIELDANALVSTAPGLYTADLQSWLHDNGLNQDVEAAIAGQAPVTVISQRSNTPVVSGPVANGHTSVAGTTTEAAGSTVRVYVNGNATGSGTSSAGGTFSVSVPTLFAGQRVIATVQASGEIESLASPAVEVIAGRIFADDPLIVGSTLIKALHLTEVRDAVNDTRAKAGLTPATWADAAVPGLLIKAAQINELRSALTPALAILGQTASYTDPTLAAGNVVKAVHVQEIRNYTR